MEETKMNYCKQDSYFFLDSTFQFIEYKNSYLIRYIGGDESFDIASYKNPKTFIEFAKELFNKKHIVFSDLINDFYNTAYFSPQSDLQKMQYNKLVEYLHKLHSFFSFSPEPCNYDMADKFIIKILVRHAYTTEYFPDFVKYLEQNPQEISIKMITQHFLAFNQRIFCSLLFPVSSRTCFIENFTKYDTALPLYEFIERIGNEYKEELLHHVCTCANRDPQKHLSSITLSYRKPFSRIYGQLQNYELIINEYESKDKLQNLSPEQFYLRTILNESFYNFNDMLNQCRAINIREYIFKTLFRYQADASAQLDAIYVCTFSEAQKEVLCNPDYKEAEWVSELKEIVSVTEFYNFEQFICLELNILIRQKQLLKICPSCDKPFLTKSNKIKYCNFHRNIGKYYQQKYKGTPNDHDEYYNAVFRFKTTIDKRKRRLPAQSNLRSQYQDCIWEADNLLEQNPSIPIEQFNESLSDLLTQRGLPPIRKYNKN